MRKKCTLSSQHIVGSGEREVLKVTIDTNVWVSSLIAIGNAYTVKERFEQGEFQLYLCAEMLEELRGVLARPKFANRINQQNAENLTELIAEVGIFIKLRQDIEPVSRDPADDIYLACVKLAGCDYLVTGDSDLLILGKHATTQIVAPAQFVMLIEN
jgi:uncharacterized protein